MSTKEVEYIIKTFPQNKPSGCFTDKFLHLSKKQYQYYKIFLANRKRNISQIIF